MNRNPAMKRPQLPTKWLVAIVFGLVVYGLTQPLLNSRFGLNLPSVASLLGQQSGAESQVKDSPTPNSGESSSDSEALRKNTEKSPASDDKYDSSSSLASELAASDDDLKFGFLKDLGGENYLSPAGLRYTRGSAEGHRLAHIERHLEDQPTRPGKHGVFYGDMPQVLRWLDEGYERAQAGSKGTSKRKEGGRTVIESKFDKPIGFVGGRDGGRAGNPDAKSLRLVVDGDVVITAFPF